MKPESLILKINIAIFITYSIVLIFLGTIFFQSEKLHRETRVENIKLLLGSVFQQNREKIASQIFADNSESLEQTLKKIQKIEEITDIYVYRSDGSLFFSTDKRITNNISPGIKKKLDQAPFFDHTSIQQIEFVVYYTPIKVIGQNYGYLTIYYDLSDLNQEVSSNERVFIIQVFVTLLIIFVVLNILIQIRLKVWEAIKSINLIFKINGAILLAYLIVFVFLGAIFFQSEKNHRKNRLQSIELLLSSVFQQNQERLANEIFGKYNEALIESIKSIQQVKGIAHIDVYKTDRKLLFSTDKTTKNDLSAVISEKLNKQPFFDQETTKTGVFAVYSAPLQVIEECYGYLKIYYDLSELEHDESLKRIIFIAQLSVTFLILFGVLNLLLFRSIVHPASKAFKNISTELLASRKMLQLIIDNIPRSIFWKDKNLVYKGCNKSFIKIAKSDRIEDIIGKTAYQLNFDKTVVKRFETLSKEAMEKDTPILDITEKLIFNNKNRYMNANFIPLHDDAKPEVVGILCTYEDVTQKIVAQKEKEKQQWLKEAGEQLKRLSEHFMISQEQERYRIASELHDQLGQNLTALHLETAWIRDHLEKNDQSGEKRTSVMLTLIDRLIDDVRNIALRLRPDVLDRLGLIDALDWYISDFEKRTKIKSVFKYTDASKIDEKVATAAYRIVQGALNNVIRHASATYVNVILTIKDNIMKLEISDNGCGFDVSMLSKKDFKGFGIIIMKERARLAGATLTVKSTLEKGTIICFTTHF